MIALVSKIALYDWFFCSYNREVRNEAYECAMELTEAVGPDPVLELQRSSGGFTHRSQHVRLLTLNLLTQCVKLFGVNK